MDRIENFAAIPFKDRVLFADSLIKTINSEKIFCEEIHLDLVGVEPDDITGGLILKVSPVGPITVTRKASWTCDTEEDAEDVPANSETDFENYLMEDTKKAFKTLETIIEGYKVSLEVSDVDEDDRLDPEVEVTTISHEDDGIGSYEYFGFTGTDSRPYVVVEGTLTTRCDCNLELYVEVDDSILLR